MINLCYNHIRFMLYSRAIVHYTLELTASKFMAYVSQSIFHYFPPVDGLTIIQYVGLHFCSNYARVIV